MAKRKFIDKRFGDAALHTIAQANTLLRDYASKGYTMTLRQLHYQFVAKGLPDLEGSAYTNTKQSYKRLGDIMSNARLAGLVDWNHMEDRLRELERSPRWDSPSQIIRAVSQQYQQDLWEGHDVRPEVWIEKDALAGVIEPVCRELRVDYFACRGYVSQSAQFEASERFRRYRASGQEPVVFHLGDHDPSGLDMTRENEAKFALLTGERVKVVRLALNFAQVEQYNPPPNFAKTTDSRAADYISRFGEESWELDALDPDVIADLITDAIDPLKDAELWVRNKAAEEDRQAEIESVSRVDWEDVVNFANR
jgi:hypothetical protein